MSRNFGHGHRYIYLAGALASCGLQATAAPTIGPNTTPATPRYEVAEYATMDDYGDSVVVRRLNTDRETVGGVNRRGLKKIPRAFLLSAGGFDNVTTDPGTDYSSAYGLNDRGEVVGTLNTLTASVPFRRGRNKVYKPLSLLPGDTGGIAYGINDGGEAAGYSSGKTGEHAVWWSLRGEVHPLPGFVGVSSRALDINDAGDVIGSVGRGINHAVLWANQSVLIVLKNLRGYTGSEAVSISNRGEIAGFAFGTAANKNFSRAVVWARGGLLVRDLGALPGGDESRAMGVNNRGEVVGTSTTAQGNHAFLWTPLRGMVDLNTLIPASTTVLTEAMGINNQGDIVVVGHKQAAAVQGLASVQPSSGGEEEEDHEQPRQIYVLKARR